MRKTLCFVAHSGVVAKAVSERIYVVLGNYLDIVPWSLDEALKTPPKNCNLYLASNESTHNIARSVLPEDAVVLAAARFVNPAGLEKLLYLPAGTQTLIAAGTYDRALSVADAITAAGISHIQMTLHYPGGDTAGHEAITTVIVAGLNINIPPWVDTVVDIGAKEVALSTYVAIANFFDIPIDVIDNISKLHMNSTFRLMYTYYNIKKKTEAILQGIDDIVISVNVDGIVDSCNQKAEDFFGINNVVGMNVNTIFPEISRSILFENLGENFEEVLQYDETPLLIKGSIIYDASKQATGSILAARPVSLVQHMERKVRRTIPSNKHVAKYCFRDIAGTSSELKSVVTLAKRYSDTTLSILLEGETGVGKEIFAQSIHAFSKRRDGPFVALNFAALSESLAESELFGYEAGAFTGASKKGHSGLFEEAHQGTIFLDEIGDASPEMQARLLRVLEEHEVRRVGGRSPISVDVRVIAATNRRLDKLVGEGKFRSDLYYRLCACPLYIPPLRARVEDIRMLINHFAGKNFSRSIRLSDEVLAFFENYAWPGNIRELQNITNFLCCGSASANVITMSMLPHYLLCKETPETALSVRQDENHDEVQPDMEQFIRLLMEKNMREECGYLLEELIYSNRYGISAGYESLLRRIREKREGISGYMLKVLLRYLKDGGFVLTGRTKQGTQISPRGVSLLRRLETMRVDSGHY